LKGTKNPLCTVPKQESVREGRTDNKKCGKRGGIRTGRAQRCAETGAALGALTREDLVPVETQCSGGGVHFPSKSW